MRTKTITNAAFLSRYRDVLSRLSSMRLLRDERREVVATVWPWRWAWYAVIMGAGVLLGWIIGGFDGVGFGVEAGRLMEAIK